MKKFNFTLSALLVLSLISPLMAQQAPQAAGEGEITEILLSAFETEGRWTSNVGSTHGSTSIQSFEQNPKDQPVINRPDGTANPNSKVLGFRILFTTAGQVTAHLIPNSPITVPGIVKSINIWVLGRQTTNKLFVIVRDSAGITHKLPFQTESGGNQLTFNGWQKMKAIVPDGHLGVRQKSNIDSKKPFVVIERLELEFPSSNTVHGEEFFIYLDDLTAETDTYTQNMRSDDDISDNWY